jgi:hypothetical protein
VQKSRRIDHQAKLAPLGGEGHGAFETVLVQQIDRRGRAATEGRDMLEVFRNADGFQDCCADPTAGTENDRDAGRWKRSKLNPLSTCAFVFERPGHPRLDPSRTALSCATRRGQDPSK